MSYASQALAKKDHITHDTTMADNCRYYFAEEFSDLEDNWTSSILADREEADAYCLDESVSGADDDKRTNDKLLSQNEIDCTTAHIRSRHHPEIRKSKSSSPTAHSLHHSSEASLGYNASSKSESDSLLRLKPNSTSPAALSSLDFQSLEIQSDDSARLTPTHSNFDESQLISPSMGISYHPQSHTLKIQQSDLMGKQSPSSSSYSKQGSFRKKKRSGSWYNVLSPSYKQKNEDFRKFFKDLPVTERLLVDYACALVKDILVQGRLYVSQNYLCFHSTILKWQTVVTVNLVDIDQMTKEKTVKVIPNAIQVLLKDKTKMTFTSFTARDRAFVAIFRLWQNALLDQPISAMQLWSQIHRNYGEELGGCSSDDDYVKPKQMLKKHEGIGDDGEVLYQFGTTNKIKRSANAKQSPNDCDFDKSNRSSKSTNSSRENHASERHDVCFAADDESSHSSRGVINNSLPTGEDDHFVEEDAVNPVQSHENDAVVEEQQVRVEEPDESDDEPTDFMMQNLPKHSFTRIYETSVKDMHRIIFSDDCPFWKDTLVNKGTTGISFGTWGKDDSTPGQLNRELSYTLRLDNSFGPKTSFVKETQIYYPCSVDGKSYVVDCIAQNYGIPYADYFHTAMRYSIRKVTKNSCQLRITWELRYQKSPWGLVKNFIEKNVASGMSANFKKLQAQLQEQIDQEKSESQAFNVKASAKSNVRRRKRKSVSSAANTSLSRRRSSAAFHGKENDQAEIVQDESNERQRTSSTVVTGVPPLFTPNGFIPNESNTRGSGAPKLHYFGQGGKFIFGAMLFLLILLLYSNYNMSQRLNTLEQVTAAAATADGVDPSVTAALLDRPGVPITSNPEMLSSYLQAIDKRLRRLEESVTKFTEESISKWEKIEKQWEMMEELVKKLIKSSLNEGR